MDQRFLWVMKRAERVVKLQSSEVQQALEFQECFGNSAVQLKHANSDRALPPRPCGLPRGDSRSRVLITTLSLFDPTDCMAVRPPGKRDNSCTPMVMARGPDVTYDTWSRPGKLSRGLFRFLPAAV